MANVLTCAVSQCISDGWNSSTKTMGILCDALWYFIYLSDGDDSDVAVSNSVFFHSLGLTRFALASVRLCFGSFDCERAIRSCRHELHGSN